MKVRERGYEKWEDAREYSESDWEDSVAQEFASYCYNQDPCDPDKFEIVIEVLNDENEIKVFTVSAEADINFYAEEFNNASE